MSSSLRNKAAIFDGDDTLWRTEILYDQARQAARDVVSRYGIDPDLWEARQRIIDVENVAAYGFSSARFPASCLQAFEEISGTSRDAINPIIGSEITHAAQSVFRENPSIFPNVPEVLHTLRRRGVALALLTKGDKQVQANRIEQSGLASFFKVIEIVSDKTTSRIRTILNQLGSDAESAWMIGNSLRSDILPAVALGMRGIWIDAPVWEYERTDEWTSDPLVHKVADIRQVLNLIQ